jgi:alpha-ribazole phosphatase
MLRARQTAEAIGSKLGVEVEYTPRLREMNLGEWQGLTRDEVEARWPGELAARHIDIANHRISGGETGAEVQKRAHSLYTELIARYKGNTLILVSHGGTLATLSAAIHGLDLNEAWVENRIRFPNSGVTALRYRHSTASHDVELATSLAHLQGESAYKGDTE